MCVCVCVCVCVYIYIHIYIYTLQLCVIDLTQRGWHNLRWHNLRLQATDFVKRADGPVLRISLFIATLLAWDKYYAYKAGQLTLSISSKFSCQKTETWSISHSLRFTSPERFTRQKSLDRKVRRSWSMSAVAKIKYPIHVWNRTASVV